MAVKCPDRSRQPHLTVWRLVHTMTYLLVGLNPTAFIVIGGFNSYSYHLGQWLDKEKVGYFLVYQEKS